VLVLHGHPILLQPRPLYHTSAACPRARRIVNFDFAKRILRITDAHFAGKKIMNLLTILAARSEKASKESGKRAGKWLVASNLYKTRENYTGLQAQSFLLIHLQHLNFAALTSARRFGISEAHCHWA
jgi:hypothetical protein